MTTHTLVASQVIPVDVDRAWSFFSRPENLGRITPSSMAFDMHTERPSMTEGTLIDYTVRPLMGIPMPWRTRIEAIEPPLRFRDVQLRGPYKRWEHSHTLTPVAGGTRIDDRIEYELPFGPVGEIAHRMIVRRELERIFRYRARAIESIFEPVAIGIKPRTVVVAGGTGFVGRRHRQGAAPTRGPRHRPVLARRGFPRIVARRHRDPTRGRP